MASTGNRSKQHSVVTLSFAISGLCLQLLFGGSESLIRVNGTERVDLAERLVNKFNGNPGLLNRALRERYGVDLTTPYEDIIQYRLRHMLGF